MTSIRSSARTARAQSPRRPATLLSRGLPVLAATAAAVMLSATGAAAADCTDQASASSEGTTYYLSLGDSLASGYQPDVDGDTDQAYTDKLFEQLKKREPGLKHIRLGCTGETAATLINGGKCDYRAEHGTETQLAAALKALDEHKGKVSYVTLDIGANDIKACAGATGAIDPTCMAAAQQTLGQNLTKIASELRQAGTENTRYAGMTYYNPFLATWLLGEPGQQTAKDSAAVVKAGNAGIAQVFKGAGFAVAEVAGAFSSDDFGTQVELPGLGKVPANVAKICRLTWMCTKQDIHANAQGHELIAGTFAAVLPEQAPADDCEKPGSTDGQPGNDPDTRSEGQQPIADKDSTAGQDNLAETGSSSATPVVVGLAAVVLALGAGTLLFLRKRHTTTAS